MSAPAWLAQRIEQWPISKLLPYARNARTHSDSQVAQIAASIAQFGFTNPVLAGSDGVIVAGHGRLAAAQRLGMETVPVVVLDHLTPTQRRGSPLAGMDGPIRRPRIRWRSVRRHCPDRRRSVTC